jgi:hypothetical protein
MCLAIPHSPVVFGHLSVVFGHFPIVFGHFSAVFNYFPVIFAYFRTYLAVFSTPFPRCGFATKRGRMVRSWKKRWFVLSGDTLDYYEDDSVRGKLKGSVAMVNARVSRGRFIFTILAVFWVLLRRFFVFFEAFLRSWR